MKKAGGGGGGSKEGFLENFAIFTGKHLCWRSSRFFRELLFYSFLTMI